MTTIDLAGPRDTCTPTCAPFVERWESWFDRTLAPAPAAAIAITDPVTYSQTIGAKSRNMLRKAARHDYELRCIDRNDHLDEIYAINQSKPIRSGGPMRDGYLERPSPIGMLPALCDRHQLLSVGMFNRDGELRAYCHLVLANELAIVNTILGHGDDLPNGIMNALIACILELLYATEQSRHVRYLNYTTLDGPEGLIRFKQSVGFRPTDLHRREGTMTDTDGRNARIQAASLVQSLVLAMQAAWIEWKHGRGAEAAMGWIENTLDGPDMLPHGDTDAQAFFDREIEAERLRVKALIDEQATA